jgi:glutamyl-Q tRNA(Asp) synthetase
MTVVTRFAPSPTGFLHLGHAHSALAGWRRAREAGGRFLLRIEDIDQGRCRPEFEAAILEDLAWLGLDWYGPVRRQSEHWDDYRSALAVLEGQGLIYPCFCTRREIQAEVAAIQSAPHGSAPRGPADTPDGTPLYPGTCRRLSPRQRADRLAEGRPYALRLDMAEAMRRAGPLGWTDELADEQVARPERQGDVVLARKETPTSYHLAVTVDDEIQGVTVVTRGRDLFEATHVHRLLQALLGYRVPVWRHHALLTDSAGRRLAKRSDAASIRAYRAQGSSAVEIRALAGFPD